MGEDRSRDYVHVACFDLGALDDGFCSGVNLGVRYGSRVGVRSRSHEATVFFGTHIVLHNVILDNFGHLLFYGIWCYCI